jgi:ABC-type polysaccharide/polyol phosphate export permease
MRVLANVNPLTYGVDVMRQILLGNQVAPTILSSLSLHTISINTLFLLGFSAVMVSAAVWAFNKRA